MNFPLFIQIFHTIKLATFLEWSKLTFDTNASLSYSIFKKGMLEFIRPHFSTIFRPHNSASFAKVWTTYIIIDVAKIFLIHKV